MSQTNWKVSCLVFFAAKINGMKEISRTLVSKKRLKEINIPSTFK
jgi:hypothetical protein